MINLERLRKAAGLNMKEAAASLKIPYTTYVSYEKGDREPNSEMLIKLAEHYGTTVDYILGREPDPAEQKSNSSRTDSPPPDRNTVRIAGRDGSYVEKNLSDEQVAALKLLIDQLPDVDDL